MKTLLLFIYFCFLICHLVESAKILVVFPMQAGSHYILGNGVARVLVEAGHEVTLISPYEEKYPPQNGTWRDIILTGFAEERKKFLKEKNLFSIGDSHPLLNLRFLSYVGKDLTRNTFNHPNVQKLLKSNEKFDAVIVEQFNFDALKVLAHHYNAPLIVLSSIGANRLVNLFVGNPGPTSYIPEIFLSYSDHMTFSERVKNTLLGLVTDVYRHLFYFPEQNQIMHEFFPNAPHLDDIIYNTSMVLLNSHVSTNQPKPYVPAMVEVGGYHIKPPKKLPKDLQEFLDGAKEGVVYFSMGSNIQSATMPKDKKEIIVKALSKLKQKVLWKWEEDTLPGKPENVKTGKWLPQNDILAHPNVKLFITHGGLLSTTETIYHGKPILALPIFGDQKMNAQQAVNNGFGLRLSFSALTEEDFSNSLNELLANPKYYQNAQKRSKIMHDRVQTPQQALVYWTEYVIRHQGAHHLRVSALDLAWYQYLLLDVFSFLIISVIAILLLIRYVVKIASKFAKQDKKTKKKDKKIKKK